MRSTTKKRTRMHLNLGTHVNPCRPRGTNNSLLKNRLKNIKMQGIVIVHKHT
jgi:hypothetical protein